MTSSDQISNTTIQTYTGQMFDVFNPDKDLLYLKDISHSLSMLCRYGGHSRDFYSVAEHCVLMAGYFEKRQEYDLARVALLHDATEAYVGDLVRPIKLQMQLYRDVESVLNAAIFSRYGLSPGIPDEVKDADLRICNDEREVLLDHRPWVTDHLEPLGVELQCWTHTQAEQAWLDTYWRLFS